MSKSISADLAAHLDGEVTTLATCWRVIRTDGREFFFTDHDRDLSFEGTVYKAATGFSRTRIASDSSLAVDNLDVEAVFDSAEIAEPEVRAGLFDFAEVRVFLVNWAAPAQGALRLRRGRLGEVTLSPRGTFRTELRGLTQALGQRIGELYSPECRADLGDPRCKVPIYPDEVLRETAYALGDYVRVRTAGGGGPVTWADYEHRVYRCVTAGTTASVQPTYDTTVGTQTADGTAVFEAEESLMRAAEAATVQDRRTFTVTGLGTFADGWFAGGLATFETGANAGPGSQSGAGRSMEVKAWTQASGQIALFLPMPFAIAPGDKLRVYPGCDKRLVTCRDRFANVLNFRGEPHVPGSDFLMTYPDAK